MSRTYFWPMLRLVAYVLCAATVAGFAGRGGWLLDLLSEFRLQYLILLALLCGIFLVGRKGGMMLLTAAFALANLWPVVSPAISFGSSTNDLGGITLLSVLSDPTSSTVDSIATMVRGRRVDIVAIGGASTAGLERLGRLLPDHRYRQAQTREDPYGVAILSRYPIISGRIALVGRSKSPVAIARCRLPGGDITFVVARMIAGWGEQSWEERNAGLADLGTLVAGEKGDLVLVGSLELSPWSPYFTDLLARSHLLDGRHGNGVEATWPAWMGGVGIPLDHLLHGDGVLVDDLSAVGVGWSSHRPLVATIRPRQSGGAAGGAGKKG